MRKWRTIAISMFSLALLAGCSGAKPESTVEAFFTAGQKLDTDAMVATVLATGAGVHFLLLDLFVFRMALADLEIISGLKHVFHSDVFSAYQFFEVIYKRMRRPKLLSGF